MSSTRIESTLTAESTTLANPNSSDEPMFIVKILLQRKCQKLVSITGGPQDLPVDEWQIGQHSALIEIPCQLVTQPESCLVYLAYMISSFVFPSDSLSNYVASRIASFAGDLSRRGCFGFYLLAQVRVVEEIVTCKDNNTEPMFLVQFLLERKKETWVRVRGRSVALRMDDNRQSPADPTSCIFQIPHQVVDHPDSCCLYIAHMISSFNFGASLSNDLASSIADFSDNLVRTGCFGFFVLAHVKIVEETVHVVEPLSDPDQHVAVSTGASKRVLKKLKKETFCMNQGQSNGDSSSGGTCVVCLEEFSSSVKLTKLPCSHVFHKKCIFRWLRNSKSCPVCRAQVE
ncbi:hypothetical protein SADUNF_Sadunf13G0092600 [Salix dunnii]|uniref:RING-type domain-containing protein n=1 Tax=Salix dunnii TaxID=1413687 RepID=A0A835JGA7_9ROSI|nr:hypothetical protein SADUNF_Sadunf13G0092600 [Salix dunnii]